jgi:HlyD family secretion protein
VKKISVLPSLLLLILISCNEKEETIKPTTGRLNEAVYASGKVVSINQYAVYSPVTGLILDILVDEGDTVHEGDALYRIDNKTLELNSDNARLALELTRENSLSGSDKLRELELASQTAREKYELDSSLFTRQKKLWDQGIGAKVDFEQRELSLVTSRNNYFATKAKISEIKKQLRNELSRAENTYAITQKQQSDFIVRSLINGIVFEITKERGELISPQTALGVIGDGTLYHLELEVDEYDVVRILPGQKIEISMDSRRGDVYEAIVTKVRPLMNERTRSFVVEAAFTKTPPTLFPNLTVEANIILQSKENALTIPREYLIENEFVMVDGEKRKVKTGLKDFNKIEILEGIDSTTAISKPETK